MSILYGYIELNKKDTEPAILKKMESSLAGYKFDSHTTLRQNNVGMGSLNQCITYESRFDKLPLYSREDGLYFVCDAIIDNRDELIGILGLQPSNELPDSRIIFESYRKWGKDCTQHLLGDFAFAVYEERENRVRLFRDHMGKRTMYYRVEDDRVFFSTLIKPLVDPFDKREKNALNERYLVEFLSIKGVRQDITPGETIYNDIKYVLPACCLTVSDDSAASENYWDPSSIKVDRGLLKTDYIGEFRRIFNEAVKCRLRTDGDIGIYVSGGLDSGSVACTAATILGGINKSLNTYTSVPHTGFTNWAPRHEIVDESAYIRRMQAFYPNMNTHFIESEGKNSLNIIEKILYAFEQPYKFVDNSYWIEDILQNASGDGCKVILNGFFGNATVSFGSYNTYLFEHVMRFRFRRFFKDFNVFCQKNRVNRRRFLKILFKKIINTIFAFEEKDYLSEIVKPEYLVKYDTIKKMRSMGFSSKPLLRFRDEQSMFYHPTVMNHVSSSVAKLGLVHNICERDPTSDKRLVEFCLRLPYECYFYKGKGLDRGLIRRAMEGAVPPEILENKFHGLQAVDWLERIKVDWKTFIGEFSKEPHESNDIFKFINVNFLNEQIEKHLEYKYSFGDIRSVREIIIIFICKKFMDML